MRLDIRPAALTVLAIACLGTAPATAQPEADSALRMGEMSVPFEGKIGKGPAAQRTEFEMSVVHKLSSRSFTVKPGVPKRVSEIATQPVPVTCGTGDEAFESATAISLPRAYKLRGKRRNVAAKFKAVRNYRHVSGDQVRVVMRGKLTKGGKRGRGTIRIVVNAKAGAGACRANLPWSGRRA